MKGRRRHHCQSVQFWLSVFVCRCRCLFVYVCVRLAVLLGDKCSEEELFYSSKEISRDPSRVWQTSVSVCEEFVLASEQQRAYSSVLRGNNCSQRE